MAKADLIPLEGTVVSLGRGGLFNVETESGHQIVAKLAGKMRRFRIRVVLGDRVTVSVSPYDPDRGLITFRHRS